MHMEIEGAVEQMHYRKIEKMNGDDRFKPNLFWHRFFHSNLNKKKKSDEMKSSRYCYTKRL